MKDESQKNVTEVAGKKRFTVFAVCLVLASCAVLGRYGYLMLFLPVEASLPSGDASSRMGRGPILDRNGRVLALDTRLGNITLWRAGTSDREALSRELAPLLGQHPDEILSRINNSRTDFIYLLRQANESTVRLVEAKMRDGFLRGVGIEHVFGRIYPEKNLAGQVIGFIGSDGQGLAGIEHSYDTELSSSGGLTPGRRTGGSQVYLTIDIHIQYILQSIAEKVMAENKAEAVIFMASDPRSGDILASVSLPAFDPNNFLSSTPSSRMDRSAIWAYEPGSVFKVFSLACLMNSRAISETSIFNCNSRYELISSSGKREIINCLSAHGNVGVREIIVYSCNAGAAYASDRLDNKSFYEEIGALGFGSRTGTGYPGETSGYLRPPERWQNRSKPTISMGQEIAVSALQVLKAASAIANDGVLVPPRIVSRIVSSDGRTITNAPDNHERQQVLSAHTARAMRSYMAAAASDSGTGWRAALDDLSLAVKTGTAQIIDSQTGAYSSTDFIASCIALLPADSPSLVLYLVIVKPQGASYLGGRIAAPPIREAAEALINYLGIPRGRNPEAIHSGIVSFPAQGYPFAGGVVPDFTGVAKRLLQPLVIRSDLRLRVSGEGWVVRQSPPPGAPLTEDTVIILELE